MTEPSSIHSSDTSLTRDLFDLAHHYLSGRRGIIVLAIVAVAAGLAFNWSWLVAAGLAPVLLTVLPCAAMCALGLCMNRMGGRSCSADTSAPTSRDARTDETATSMQEIPPVASTAGAAPKPQPERRLTDA